jgi:hypothetical protein
MQRAEQFARGGDTPEVAEVQHRVILPGAVPQPR